MAFKKGHPASKTAFKKGDPRLVSENNPAKRQEVRIKISEAKKGHIVTKKTRRKIGLFQKNRKRNPCLEKKKRKIGEKNSILMKEKWKNKKYRGEQIKKILKGMLKRPSSFEQKICDLCLKYHLPFFYTGDGRFLVGYKNPDFKHKYLPILIEVYNDYHHPKNYEEVRGEHFVTYGYKTIFINQQEVTDKNWETICLNKIKNSL